MNQDITQLLGKFMFLSLEDCITKFINLLQSLRTELLVGLLPIPRALFPKFVKNIKYPSERLHFFFSCMHHMVWFSKSCKVSDLYKN